MPRSSKDHVPAHYMVGGAWPEAVLAADAPVSAYYGQRLAYNLQTVMTARGFNLRVLAERSGVAHTTISRVLRGRVLPDMGTIARLEVALGVQVFPKPTPLSETHNGNALALKALLHEVAAVEATRLTDAVARVAEAESRVETARAALASAQLRADASSQAAAAVDALIRGAR